VTGRRETLVPDYVEEEVGE